MIFPRPSDLTTKTTQSIEKKTRLINWPVIWLSHLLAKPQPRADLPWPEAQKYFEATLVIDVLKLQSPESTFLMVEL